MTLVIWNGNAGGKRIGGGPASADDVAALLARHGIEADVRATDSDDEARSQLKEALARGDELVIAAGGDGTVGALVPDLMDRPVALGILPFGSVMNVVRMLGIPRDPEAAAEDLANGLVREIDVGLAEGEAFLETGSVGMNAAVFREAERFGDGDWTSIVRTIWVAIRYRPARMAIELDDRALKTRALMVTISNGPYVGAGMTVAPDAQLDDGLLDIGVWRRFSKFELVRHLASIAFGRRRYTPQVDMYRSRRVRITSAHPLPSRADSRDLGTTPVEFSVRPRALRVIVPRSPEDAGATALT
jgi:diacylglycerol kinase (ATP)